MSALSFAAEELKRLEAQNLLRRPRIAPAGAVILCSNDYLGFADHPLESSDAPGGSGASRLVTGHSSLHDDAEAAISEWVTAEKTLIFSSGYAANVGLISAIAQEDDLFVSDELNHASIIDGCRLSRARTVVVPHLDVRAVRDALTARARRKWVITESVFSMDGDAADLVGLREVCDQAAAGLVVDEAHALGVIGPEGAGLCRAAGVSADVIVGGLGKAVGLQGGFVSSSASLIALLWNRARSFVFSTGLSPALTHCVPERVRRVRAAETARIQARQQGREIAEMLGVERTYDHPVVPWILGSEVSALAAESFFLGRGMFAGAIRPPTVPAGTSRIRLSMGANLSAEEFLRARAVLHDARSTCHG